MRLTMPEKSERERRRLLERHFAVLGEVMMDMLWALSADAESVRKLMTVEGRLPGSCILLAPHFVGMDIGSLRLSLDLGERGELLLQADAQSFLELRHRLFA